MKDKKMKELVETFIEVFPGRCMICYFHAFGLMNGMMKTGTPVDAHDCIENNSNKAK